jgi:hypothetical protein
MNPQHTSVGVRDNVITYSSAWLHTDLQYTAYSLQLKETLIIYAVSPWSSGIVPDYLQYVSNCYYDASLTIVADGVKYLHPVNQKFTTSNEITFQDDSGNVVFMLPVPYVRDSGGNSVLGTYAVVANNGVLVINIRIPASFINSATYPVYFDPPVRVQGSFHGDSTTVNVSVTLGARPTAGDVIVAALGSVSNPYSTVSSITQTGVTWSQQVQAQYVNGGTGMYVNSEIWLGVVGYDASASMAIVFSRVSYANICDVYEYSGVRSLKDVTAASAGATSATTDTGSVATNYASELWIGSIAAHNFGQDTPTNGFTLYDGSLISASASLALLDKIVSSTGTANTGTSTGSALSEWVGCVACFVAGYIDLPPILRGTFLR